MCRRWPSWPACPHGSCGGATRTRPTGSLREVALLMERNYVVVTGGAGFIGSELVRQLADAGERVVAVDNLVNGKRENLSEVLGDRVVLVEQDIRNAQAM